MLPYLVSTRRFAITFDQFERLPRHPSYRYEYVDGHAHITPRMRGHTAVLPLKAKLPQPAREVPFELDVQPLASNDWVALVNVFDAAFADHPPLCDVAEGPRRAAVGDALALTQEGGYGSVLYGSSMVARDADSNVVAFIIVTLVNVRRKKRVKSVEATTTNVQSFLAPHLTWVAVTPMLQRLGIGSRLLVGVVSSLRADGRRLLCSTFLDANISSVLWHWRNGFKLAPEYAAAASPPETARTPDYAGRTEEG